MSAIQPTTIKLIRSSDFDLGLSVLNKYLLTSTPTELDIEEIAHDMLHTMGFEVVDDKLLAATCDASIEAVEADPIQMQDTMQETMLMQAAPKKAVVESIRALITPEIGIRGTLERSNYNSQKDIPLDVVLAKMKELPILGYIEVEHLGSKLAVQLCDRVGNIEGKEFIYTRFTAKGRNVTRITRSA